MVRPRVRNMPGTAAQAEFGVRPSGRACLPTNKSTGDLSMSCLRIANSECNIRDW